MRLRFVARLLVCLVIPGVGSGCLQRWLNPNDRTPTASEVNAEVANNSELPPKEAVKLEIAAAQRFESAGKATEAINMYEKARSQGATDAQIGRRLAVLYDRVGKFEKADEEYEKAIAKFPNDADLLNDAGYSHYCRGNWAQAEDYLRQAVGVRADCKRAWINLGMTLAMRDRPAEAFDAFCKAVPEAQSHANLAFAYTLLGKRADAIREYKLALSHAPDLDRARQALAKLESSVADQSAVQTAPRRNITMEAKETPTPIAGTGGFAEARVD